MHHLNLSFRLFDSNSDREAMPLCHAINCIPGLQTVESCSGHGTRSLEVYFKAKNFQGLSFLVRCIDRRYCQDEWKLELSISDTVETDYVPIIYCLSTYRYGEQAYQQASRLIKNFEDHLNNESFMKLFGLQISDFDCYNEGEVKNSFANRDRMTLEEAKYIYGIISSWVRHIIKNEDGTYSIMSHINCEWCDYCEEREQNYRDTGEKNKISIHMAKENPYENVSKDHED